MFPAALREKDTAPSLVVLEPDPARTCHSERQLRWYSASVMSAVWQFRLSGEINKNGLHALLRVYSFSAMWYEKRNEVMHEDWGVLWRKVWGTFKTDSRRTCWVRTSFNFILTATSVHITGASESSTCITLPLFCAVTGKWSVFEITKPKTEWQPPTLITDHTQFFTTLRHILWNRSLSSTISQGTRKACITDLLCGGMNLPLHEVLE